MKNEKLRSNSQNSHRDSIEQASGSDQMTKAPSKVCSNPSNLVFNDPALKVESCVLEKVRGNLVLLICGFGFAILIVSLLMN